MVKRKPNKEYLYHKDFHAWLNDQARVLRKVEQGDVKALSGIDFSNLIPTLELMAEGEVEKVEHALQKAMKNIIRIAVFPASDSLKSWMRDTGELLEFAGAGFSPCLGQYIDMETMWAAAISKISEEEAGGNSIVAGLPATPPFEVGQLVHEDFNIDFLVSLVRDRMSACLPGAA